MKARFSELEKGSSGNKNNDDNGQPVEENGDDSDNSVGWRRENKVKMSTIT